MKMFRLAAGEWQKTVQPEVSPVTRRCAAADRSRFK